MRKYAPMSDHSYPMRVVLWADVISLAFSLLFEWLPHFVFESGFNSCRSSFDLSLSLSPPFLPSDNNLGFQILTMPPVLVLLWTFAPPSPPPNQTYGETLTTPSSASSPPHAHPFASHAPVSTFLPHPNLKTKKTPSSHKTSPSLTPPVASTFLCKTPPQWFRRPS